MAHRSRLAKELLRALDRVSELPGIEGFHLFFTCEGPQLLLSGR
jgi:hypothetical protein